MVTVLKIKIVKRIVKYVLLMCVLNPGFGVNAQKTNKPVTLKVRVYTKSPDNIAGMAHDISVRVVEIIDKSIWKYSKRSGRFSMILEANKHYFIEFKKDGYESRTLAFSTVGINTAKKHLFKTDLLLTRVGSERSGAFNSFASITYDYLNNNNYVLSGNDLHVSSKAFKEYRFYLLR